MGWRFGFAKVAAQVSASVEDFCNEYVPISPL
jgi:hypothetical protein